MKFLINKGIINNKNKIIPDDYILKMNLQSGTQCYNLFILKIKLMVSHF